MVNLIVLQLDLCLRIGVAAILSGIVGYNRERNYHPAGLRTHILVGVGSALFTVLSISAFGSDSPGRVAAQIVVGIGFLGAGTIIRNNSRDVHGMTTAADIWAVAGIGMACGVGYYVVAVFAAVIIWFTLAVLRKLDRGGRATVPPDSDNQLTG
jgi:putative Mg2+ transporter-C (MgtC) family protein